MNSPSPSRPAGTFVALGLVWGAGAGTVIGLVLAGGPGIALGGATGAGLGVVAGAVAEQLVSRGATRNGRGRDG